MQASNHFTQNKLCAIIFCPTKSKTWISIIEQCFFLLAMLKFNPTNPSHFQSKQLRMSSNPQNAITQRPVLELKSSSFTVPLLVLNKYDLHLISDQLAFKVQQAPEFFKNSPLIIDLDILVKTTKEIDLKALFDIVRKHKFIPVGIRGGKPEHNTTANELGIPVQSATQTNRPTPKPQKIEPAPVADQQPDNVKNQTKIITHPVRSGQRVYAKGDLIVLSQVSAGSEIMAEGNIHIYGTLRGRALAGVQGSSNSRIFCSDLQAELVSIDGIYKISDDLNDISTGKPVQLFLSEQNLVIEYL